jgi:Mg2+ and Co2+ transporter CorA
VFLAARHEIPVSAASGGNSWSCGAVARSIAKRLEKEFLQAVIEFYRTRTETKLTIAAERLAVIAAVTLPITVLALIWGMNVVVNARADLVLLAVVLAVMVVISAALLRWAKRQGWWWPAVRRSPRK